MSDEEFDARVASMERRFKRILAAVASLAAALGVTVLGAWAVWDQVHEKIEQVDSHLEYQDARLDAAE